jgi:hypothetical protein
VCPSTESTDAQREFAADVLRNLLSHIAEQNTEGRYTYLVSHAWTDGPWMYLVYTAPPSDITWGLVRDTKVSTIDPGPWPSVDEAVPRRTGVRHRQERPRRGAAEIKIRPLSTSLAATQIHYEHSART